MSHRPDWLIDLAQAFNDPIELLKFLELDPLYFTQDLKARQLFAVRVPLPFAQKIKKGDPNDPLLLQVLCSKNEFIEHKDFEIDPLKEQSTKAPNILHKYKNRVLFMLKNSCAVNCRYCFRRHFPYTSIQNGKNSWLQGLDYIQNNQQLEEVIFSGGDPLMARDEELEFIIKQIEKIPHIKRIRIHSRLPVVIPNRLTENLAQILANSPLQALIVFHINHANEIDEFFKQKLKIFKQKNITLLNQSVLLKGVNDCAFKLKDLSEKLFSYGIMPYYLHLLDKVAGASHFLIDDKKALQIYNNLQCITSGYLVPKLAREEPFKAHKTIIS